MDGDDRIRRVSGAAFVGRAAEVELFDRSLVQALAGRGSALVVHGEGGIGKTCLVECWAERAELQDCLVSRVSCWEGNGAPSYWPWRAVLRACRGRQPSQPTEPDVFDAPETGGAVAADDAASEDGRFRLFARVVSVIEQATAQQPLLLILENLHAADADSLHLFHVVAREAYRMRVVLVGTYRDTDWQHGPLLQPLLARLSQHSLTVALRGLNHEQSESLLWHVLGEAGVIPNQPGVDTNAAVNLHRVTGGNPFFIKELARSWPSTVWSVADAELPPIPVQVREVVHPRLNGLSQSTLDALAVAAIIGRDFDARVLGRALGDAAHAASGLRQALAASVIAPLSGTVTRFAFAHALIRETILSDSDEETQARWHIRVAEALVDTYDLTPERQRAQDATAVAQVAHHYYRAARHGAAWEATRYAALAAQDAHDAHAFDQAVEQWQQALQALEFLTDASPELARQRCELLLGLGTALNAAGARARARQTFLQAADVARAEGDRELLARAAHGYGGEWLGFVELARADEAYGAADPMTRGLLQEAIAGLPRNSPWRPVLQSRLAVELYFTGPLDERKRLADDAVRAARGECTPAILGKVLSAAHVATWSPDNRAERLALAAEIVDLGATTRQPLLEGAGRAYTVANLLEGGEHERVAIALNEFSYLANQARLPGLLWAVQVIEAGRALSAGRFDEAESKARGARRTGSTMPQAAMAAYSLQIVALRREQGRLGELRDAFATWAAVSERLPHVALLHSSLAWLYAELGDERAAQRAVDYLVRGGFDKIERNNVWLQVMTELAEALWLLQERSHAAELYDLLLPFAERNTVTLFCASSWGSVARSLGLLSALSGNNDRAEQHLLSAIERNRAASAWLWVAHSQYACAHLLAESGAGRERATVHLKEAQAIAAELGVTLLQQRCVGLEVILRSGPGKAPRTIARKLDAAAPEAEKECQFRRHGEYWTLGFEGTTIRVKEARGLAYIALLLRYPHRDLPALQIACADSGVTPPPESGDAARMLDPKARRAYQSRLQGLRESLAEADEQGNPERAEAVRAEIDLLAHELSRATGLGGRDRRSGSAAERARINVNRAIAAAIRRIETQHSPLGLYLKRTIKTGTTCTYKPGLDQLLDWQL